MNRAVVAQVNISLDSEKFVPHIGPVWKITLYMTPVQQAATFWSTLWNVSYDSLSGTPLTVGSVVVDLTNYDEVGSLSLLYSQGNSFYWDEDEQTLYIHFSDGKPYYAFDIIVVGEAYNFIDQAQVNSSGRPINVVFGDRYYEPRLTSELKEVQTIDDLGKNKMTFDSFTFTIDNSNGSYDNVRERIYGQSSKMLLAESEQPIVFSDFQTIAKGSVEDVVYNDDNTISVRSSDPRKSWNTKANSEILTQTQWPNLDSSDVDKRVPIAVGTCYNIPTIQVNSTIFLFSTTTYGAVSADVVYVDGVSTSFVDNTDGTFTIAGYSTGTVTADVTGVDKGNIVEMILWFISQFAGIQHTSSNYNMTEVQAMIDISPDGGYYCKSAGVKLKDIVDFLSGSVNVYVFIQGDVLSMRNIDIDGIVTEIFTDQLLITPAPWQFDGERFASTYQIGYKKNWKDDEYSTLYDESKKTQALRNNKQDFPGEMESALLNITDAQTVLSARYNLSILAQRIINVELGTPLDFGLLDYVAFTHERPGKGIIVERSKYRVVGISKAGRTASLLYVEPLADELIELIFDFKNIGQVNDFDFKDIGQTQIFDFTPAVKQEITV